MRMWSGRAFQVAGPHVRNARSPNYTLPITTTAAVACYYYARLTASFLGQPEQAQVPKGKTSLDLSEARDDGVFGWQWHQLDHMLHLADRQTDAVITILRRSSGGEVISE